MDSMEYKSLSALTIIPVALLVSLSICITYLLQGWLIYIPTSVPVMYSCIAAVIVVLFGRWAISKNDAFTSILACILNLLMTVSLVGNFIRFLAIRDQCDSNPAIAPLFCSRFNSHLTGSIVFLTITTIPTSLAYLYASLLFFRNFQFLRSIHLFNDEGAAVVGVPVKP